MLSFDEQIPEHFDEYTYLLKTRHAPVPTHNGQAGLTALFLVGVETMTDQGQLILKRWIVGTALEIFHNNENVGQIPVVCIQITIYILLIYNYAC